MGKLSPKEKAIVGMRFDLDKGGVRTLEEIGEIFRITRQRVHFIEQRALGKLGVEVDKTVDGE